MSGKKPILLITKSKSQTTNDKKEILNKQQLEVDKEIQKSIELFTTTPSSSSSSNTIDNYHHHGSSSTHTDKSIPSGKTWIRGGIVQTGNSDKPNVLDTDSSSLSSSSIYYQQYKPIKYIIINNPSQNSNNFNNSISFQQTIKQ